MKKPKVRLMDRVKVRRIYKGEQQKPCDIRHMIVQSLLVLVIMG